MLLVRLKRCADSLQCFHLARGCAGGSNTNCDPYIMWSGSSANVSLYYYFAFSGGSFSQSSYAAGQPFSVRCCLIGVFSAPAAAFTFALAATHCVFWFCGGFGIFYNIYSYILSSALRNCLCC